jgi:DNA-binding transcriptional MerR regulator
MKTQLFTVKDVIKITGITKRGLHYYDKIELLKPSKIADNGYRFYDQKALASLQTILLFKEMNFSLNEISQMMRLSRAEQKEILTEHRSTLVQRKQKLETVINQLDEYVKGTDIYHLDMFRDSPILSIQEQYESEAKFVYGDTEKYQEFEAKVNQMSATEKDRAYQQFSGTMENVFHELAKLKDESPTAAEVQTLISKWKSCLEEFMVCDAKILLCIAEVYTTDSRYLNYFNQYAEGDFSGFVSRSILYFVKGTEA